MFVLLRYAFRPYSQPSFLTLNGVEGFEGAYGIFKNNFLLLS